MAKELAKVAASGIHPVPDSYARAAKLVCLPSHVLADSSGSAHCHPLPQVVAPSSKAMDLPMAIAAQKAT